jgi:hypothetical protein
MQTAAVLLLILACALLGVLWMLRRETTKNDRTVWLRVPLPIKDHPLEWMVTFVAGITIALLIFSFAAWLHR